MKSAILSLLAIGFFFTVAYVVKREWQVPECNITAKIGGKAKTYEGAKNCSCLNGLCNYQYVGIQYEGIEGFIHE
jgi:hypothetical protein